MNALRRVVIADPRIVDRRAQWRERMDAQESEELRVSYFAQSASEQRMTAYEYEREAMATAQPELEAL